MRRKEVERDEREGEEGTTEEERVGRKIWGGEKRSKEKGKERERKK